MAVHTAHTGVPCLTMHLGVLFNNTITEYLQEMNMLISYTWSVS
jgi:hypothetical protein